VSKRESSLLKFYEALGIRRHKRSFGDLTAQDVANIIQLTVANLSEAEDLLKFIKTHKKIARELTLEEIQNVMDVLSAKDVLER